MKRCPECRRDYTDETLNFCLDDGAALVDGPASVDEPATAILEVGRISSEQGTRTIGHNVAPTGKSGVIETVEPKRNVSKRTGLIAAGLALLVIGLGVGCYFYYGRNAGLRIDSLAIMPFVNESGNIEYEYLSDGLTETLINNLSQLPDLSVKARSSVFSYKGKNASLQQIGTELAVQAVLNGRVLQRGDNITISVELVDARNGNQIWGEQYNQKLVDLTALQSSIARDVSNKLHQKLTAAEDRQVAKNYTTNSDAYQLYLKGLFHWNKRTVDDLKTAIVYFDQAREKDPSFALAYVGLALTYSVLPSNTLLTKEETNEANLKGKAAALRALELDNSLAEPYAVLAMAKVNEWDFAGAENEFKRAIEINPNYATAHQWYSELLGRQGRIDEALVEIKKAYEVDPFSTAVNMNVGLRYLEAARTDEAVTQFKKTIELSPDYPMAYWSLADIYLERGMYEESFAMSSKGNLLLKVETPESEERKTSELRQAVKAEGVRGYWRKALEYEMEWYERGLTTPFYVAAVYAELGDKDKAFEWLEKAYVTHAFDLANLKTNRRFRSLHSDPRFHDLVRRIGLSQ